VVGYAPRSELLFVINSVRGSFLETLVRVPFCGRRSSLGGQHCERSPRRRWFAVDIVYNGEDALHL
jgi:hypothetical protein